MGKQKETWGAEQIPDLTGKIIIVTGANSGIGFEAAKEFARKGAQTIMACRNMEKAEKAKDSILQAIPDASVEVMELDLASLASVRLFAETFLFKHDQLDVLLNNAGIMMVPYGTTEDGFERQLGTNHLGHFALTGLLLDAIKKTPGARVVNVSSSGHRMGTMNFDNLMFNGGRRYSPIAAYGRSKLANLLFTYELQRRFAEHNIDAMALAAHPGGSDTNLGNHLKKGLFFKLVDPLVSRMMQSAELGALPSLRACVDPHAKPAEYYGPRGFMEIAGFPVVVSSNKASHNLEDAKRLWEVSEEVTKVTYTWG